LSIQARIQVSSGRLPTFVDLLLPFAGGDNMYDLHIFHQGRKNISKTLKKDSKTPKKLCKNQGGVKTVSGLRLSLVSGKYHEDGGSVVMEMASYGVKIRHVFCFTCLPAK
jgi:hypothetical protein